MRTVTFASILIAISVSEIAADKPAADSKAVRNTVSQQGRRAVERLDRGLVAVPESEGEVFLSWRMLGLAPESVRFNLFRKVAGGQEVRLNDSPLIDTCLSMTAGVPSGQRFSHLEKFPHVDVGRGVAFDIDPNHRGFEFWSSAADAIYNVRGDHIASRRPPSTFGSTTSDCMRLMMSSSGTSGAFGKHFGQDARCLSLSKTAGFDDELGRLCYDRGAVLKHPLDCRGG